MVGHNGRENSPNGFGEGLGAAVNTGLSPLFCGGDCFGHDGAGAFELWVFCGEREGAFGAGDLFGARFAGRHIEQVVVDIGEFDEAGFPWTGGELLVVSDFAVGFAQSHVLGNGGDDVCDPFAKAVLQIIEISGGVFQSVMQQGGGENLFIINIEDTGDGHGDAHGMGEIGSEAIFADLMEMCVGGKCRGFLPERTVGHGRQDSRETTVLPWLSNLCNRLSGDANSDASA